MQSVRPGHTCPSVGWLASLPPPSPPVRSTVVSPALMLFSRILAARREGTRLNTASSSKFRNRSPGVQFTLSCSMCMAGLKVSRFSAPPALDADAEHAQVAHLDALSLQQHFTHAVHGLHQHGIDVGAVVLGSVAGDVPGKLVQCQDVGVL